MWESPKDNSHALQMARESQIGCFAVYERDLTDMAFLCYHGSVAEEQGHGEK